MVVTPLSVSDLSFLHYYMIQIGDLNVM